MSSIPGTAPVPANTPTIALGAASCSPDVAHDLPQYLIDGLENVNYGRDYLVELDGRLTGLIEQNRAQQ